MWCVYIIRTPPIVIASLGSTVHLGHTSHSPPLHDVDDYSRARYVRTVAQQQQQTPHRWTGVGEIHFLTHYWLWCPFFCKRNSSTASTALYKLFKLSLSCSVDQRAMGYLLVISDDDECELCVYPRRTHRQQLANRIQLNPRFGVCY